MGHMNDMVAAELEAFPRGSRGSAQNSFRAAYQMARTHSLAAGSLDRWTKDECSVIARDAIRSFEPGFEPVRRSEPTGGTNG